MKFSTPPRFRSHVRFAAPAVLLILGAASAPSGAANETLRQTPRALVLSATTSAMPKTPTATVRVLASSFAPGYVSAWHTHPSPPVVYVISGAATWEYRDGRKTDVRRAGQAIMEPTGAVVRLANRGSVPVRLVLFQASEPGQPILMPAH
ncbi:MAG: cupin domain-containing protein [Candidatus Eremiobacteraeota bacterium]|nr:cupin domain-containing protein [Candidatus Eremiobacteraeota bacterium]